MDDIYGIRRKNFQALLGSPRLAKLNRELDRAEALDISPSMYSQLKSANYKIGDPLARKIEERLGLEFGWMDQSSGVAPPSQSGRIDANKLAESIAALRQVARKIGWNYDPETHPAETVMAYELRCTLPDAPSYANVIDFGDKLAERLKRRRAEGGEGEQGDGGKAGGDDRERAKGRSATKG